MKVQISIGHPAHVHFFKNIIWTLQKDWHEVKIVARGKDVTLDLLNAYKFDYEVFPKHRSNILYKAIDRLSVTHCFYKIAKRFKPDLFMGIGGAVVAHVGKLTGKPSIIFTDTEHASLQNTIAFPFATTICTPSCFKKDLGPKQIRYRGYHELAYLHPNYFTPDINVLAEMGLDVDDKFIIIRSVSLNASHDMQSRGFSNEFLEQLINALEKYGNVFIVSERKLSKNLTKYIIKLPPEKLHSALYYASLYIGDGGTTAVESAILGTPSIHVVSVKLASGRVIGASQIHGNFDEMVNKYGMLHSYTDSNQAMNKALWVLQCNDEKIKLRENKKKLLNDKIDVTAFVTDFIERYPESFYEYRTDEGTFISDLIKNKAKW